MGSVRAKTLAFWPVSAMVVLADFVTKWMAERYLVPMYVPRDVLGDVVRFTLAYNPGAAFGLHVGEHSRLVFTTLTLTALAVLARLYRNTRPPDLRRAVALALVAGGAVGNLIDRLRHQIGVVDFIDLGFGQMRWYTFNVADMAVSTGAFLLAWVLWGEDEESADQDEQSARVVAQEA
jgi:signal peptidase II